MSDIFREVDEEVRREQLKKLWDRYSLFIIIGAVLIVVGVGAWRGNQWYEAKQAAVAGSAYDAALQLARDGKHAEAAAAFAKLGADGTPGYRRLARLQEGEQLANTDVDAAVALFDQIIANSSNPRLLRDVAAIRAGFALLDKACSMMGTPAPVAGVAAEIDDYDAKVAALIADDDDLVTYVTRLEEMVDEMDEDDDGDDLDDDVPIDETDPGVLVDEVEQYLRNHDNDG